MPQSSKPRIRKLTTDEVAAIKESARTFDVWSKRAELEEDLARELEALAVGDWFAIDVPASDFTRVRMALQNAARKRGWYLPMNVDQAAYTEPGFVRLYGYVSDRKDYDAVAPPPDRKARTAALPEPPPEPEPPKKRGRAKREQNGSPGKT